MAASTSQAQIGTGGSVAWANAEGGVKWNREDTIGGLSTTPIPTATGTAYTWIKNIVLSVTVAGTTAITNRRVSLASVASTGLFLHWKALAVGSYAQAAVGNLPASSGSNGAVPAGYTLMSTTAAQYDNTSVATSGTGPNGMMAVIVAAVDNTFIIGAGVAALPNVVLTYDEA